ncbi:MAG: hypothetical protein ACK4GU_17145, partial [Alishewanella aestuarii]
AACALAVQVQHLRGTQPEEVMVPGIFGGPVEPDAPAATALPAATMPEFQAPYAHDRSHPKGAHVGPKYVEFAKFDGPEDEARDFNPKYVPRGYFARVRARSCAPALRWIAHM